MIAAAEPANTISETAQTSASKIKRKRMNRQPPCGIFGPLFNAMLPQKGGIGKPSEDAPGQEAPDMSHSIEIDWTFARTERDEGSRDGRRSAPRSRGLGF